MRFHDGGFPKVMVQPKGQGQVTARSGRLTANRQMLEHHKGLNEFPIERGRE